MGLILKLCKLNEECILKRKKDIHRPFESSCCSFSCDIDLYKSVLRQVVKAGEKKASELCESNGNLILCTNMARLLFFWLHIS